MLQEVLVPMERVQQVHEWDEILVEKKVSATCL
jgi:hypothetical protein